MKICIISSIGKQTYQGKYLERNEETSSFWNLALFNNGQPLDVVDYYLSTNGNKDFINPNRHIYTNGILLANRLYDEKTDITIQNSINDSFLVQKFDVLIISTNYITTGWVLVLKKLLEKCSIHKVKCIIGGIGIKKLFQKERIVFNEICGLLDGYILIADSGLSALIDTFNRIKNNKKDNEKVVFCDDLYDFKHEDYSLRHIDSSIHPKHTALITQTGCVYDCAFCSYKEKNKFHQFFNIQEIKMAIDELVKTNVNTLYHLRFADETFNVDNSRVIELCNFIKKQNYSFRWSCFLRANNITDELIYSLSNSGCDFVSIGVESGSRYLQRLMNKNIDLDNLKIDIKKLRDAGIIVNISLLVGFFGENEFTIEETMKYIAESKPDLARINLWYPARIDKNKALFDEYNFRYSNGKWIHNTTTQEKAIEFARKIYLMDSDTTFVPPFSSIFDQWPVLSSYGLSKNEIVNIFRNYYILAKKFANKNSNLNL